MTGQKIVQVDAFTDRPFAGNPAAVCVLETPATDEWMQRVALEMNLSETAFLTREESPGADWRLRWFTPAAEVELCGHATLASAHILWQDGHLEPGAVAHFATLSDVLTARRREDGYIEMDFPATPASPWAPPDDLVPALGVAVEPSWVGKNRYDYLLELPSAALVRSLAPDLGRLERIEGRGFIVTARGEEDGEVDFVSRFFAPRVGVPEDPVTGSAHCALAPYWAERLGRHELTGYQASARGGTVRMSLAGDRVRLAGQAVTVMRAELFV